MINTIFRFVPNEATYNNEKSQISARTIVFCEQEGSIWKNNKKYCAAAITNTEIKNLIGSTISFTPSLTSGTAIGTLRINDATTTLYAPTSSQGGGSSTTTVAVTPLISTGTPIADITVNGSTKRLYAPTSTTPTPTDPDDPETPTPSSPATVRLTEAEFQALLDAGTWEANTLYIIIDAEGKILYMWINGEYIYMAQSSGSNLKSQTITEQDWNNLTDKDMDTIYVVTDSTGNTIIGLGVSTILTRIPVPASGTTVKLTQAQYDALVAAGTVDASTLYFIVDGNGVIQKMYLGTTEVPVGTEAGEAIVKSQITRMFSEKIKWNTDGTKVDSLNWSIIDVDDPGQFYAATGFENLVKNTVKEAGFISKTDNTDNFAEMFATEVGRNSDIVKKASIRAAINNAGDSEVKIQADAVDVDGVFNAHTTNGKTASQLLLEADGISSRVSAVEGNYVKTTNINQDADSITLEAVYTNGSTSKTASIILGTNENSELTINADNINLNGKTWAQVIDADSIITDTLSAGTATIKGDIQATSFKVMDGTKESIVFTTMTSGLRSQYNNLDASGIEDGEPIGIVYSNGTPKYFFDFAPLTNTGVTTHGPMYFYTLKNTTGAAGTEINSTRGLYYDNDMNFYTAPEGYSHQKVSSSYSEYYQNLYIDYGYYTNTDYYAFVRSVEDNCWFIVYVTLYKPVSFSNGIMTISNSGTCIVSNNTKSINVAGTTYSLTCGYLQSLGNGSVIVTPNDVRDYDDDGISSNANVYGTYVTSIKTAYNGNISLEPYDTLSGDYSEWETYSY